MRTTLLVTFVSGLWLTTAGTARADDAAARQVIDKAIKALGDEAALRNAKAASWRSKGTLYAMGAELPFTAKWTVQWPQKTRMEFDLDVAGMKVNFTLVYDGAQGWIKINDMLMDMDPDRLKEQKETAHLTQVSRLLVLQDKAYTLTSLPEAKVKDKPAVGVKVSHKDYREIQLFFDKDTGLLVKSAMRAKTDQGEDVNQETFYSDYQDVKDPKEKDKKLFKVPMKILIQRDGQTYVDSQTLDYSVVDKLDDKLFEKP
jgi:hypothetical protein